MKQPDENYRRPDVRDAVRRDFRRQARREPHQRAFWRSLGVLGMIGWPIALAAVGGAVAGRWLDVQLGTGVRLTLTLLTAGTMAGCYAAWRFVRGGPL
jgi:ATP synthase protein I